MPRAHGCFKSHWLHLHSVDLTFEVVTEAAILFLAADRAHCRLIGRCSRNGRS
jgi:hypothetical protein